MKEWIRIVAPVAGGIAGYIILASENWRIAIGVFLVHWLINSEMHFLSPKK